ncbi:MAG: hypothetical protein OFPII_17620 [Osedax symbiont Rs1]|nr:MAG: hypothetical protein OFPII_17620 [Osedax symbiont Rs1]
MIKIQNSAISWRDKTPYSTAFEDYYFNSDGGIEETVHVFVTPSDAATKYAKSQSHLSINETGFGTGLNFYCTLAAIAKACQLERNKPVYFFSSELFPLSIADFKQASSLFLQFSAITEQICQQYPPAIKGYHRFILNRGGIYLTLLFDDSVSAYQQTDHCADIWFLDGFSPAKNSAMWRPELFQQIARSSKVNTTTLATFTSAGFVRRALQEVGFSITKQPGLGKKREIVSALYTDQQPPIGLNKVWFKCAAAANPVEHVAIIGAGLAGCTTAEALARRGIRVTLLDSGTDICQQASGNLQGALYAKLPSKPTLSGEFHLTGLEYSLRLLNIYQCFDDKTAQQCGVLQLATNAKEVRQQQDLLTQDAYSNQVVRWVDAQQASQLIGSQTPFNGLFFPRAGWVAPQLFCQKLIVDPLISVQLQSKITRLVQLDDQSWILHSSDGVQLAADTVVVANANSARELAQFADISTKAIRGQVTHAPANQPQTTLKTVVCGAGYISPASDGQYCFGASFDLHHQDLTLKFADQDTNIANLRKVLPELTASLALPSELTGKVAHRCSSPDYLPLVGPAPIYQQTITRYKKLNKDKNWQFPDLATPNYRGLFINTGHGSKGLITCPLSAEYLACTILGHPSPIPRNMANAIHPVRFIVKHLIRRTI